MSPSENLLEQPMMARRVKNGIGEHLSVNAAKESKDCCDNYEEYNSSSNISYYYVLFIVLLCYLHLVFQSKVRLT